MPSFIVRKQELGQARRHSESSALSMEALRGLSSLVMTPETRVRRGSSRLAAALFMSVVLRGTAPHPERSLALTS